MIYVAACQRGMSLSDFEHIEIGQVIDFVIEYNKLTSEDETNNNEGEKISICRKANQTDWNNF